MPSPPGAAARALMPSWPRSTTVRSPISASTAHRSPRSSPAPSAPRCRRPSRPTARAPRNSRALSVVTVWRANPRQGPRAENQRRPLADRDPPYQAKPASAVGRQHIRLLPGQQARQDGDPARSNGPREIAGHLRERPRQDVGEDQIVAPPLERAAAKPRRAFDPHPPREPVAPRVMPRHPHRFRVDVACPNPPRQPPRRGYRENAAPGPDIERRPKPPAPREPIERQQAPARRWVLAGPERA